MENVVVSTSKRIALDKFVSQAKVISSSNIKKILNVTASNCGTSCEATSGSVVISGKFRIDVLYLNFDNEIEKANVECDYIEKQKLQFELVNAFAIDNLVVEDVNFSSNEVICSVSHKTEVVGTYNYEIPNYSGDENVVLNNSKVAISKNVCFASDVFSVAEENETNLKDIEVLNISSNAIIDDVSCSVDKIVVEGRAVANIIYKDGAEISQMSNQVDFKQEIMAQGTTPSMKSKAYAFTKSAEAILSNAEKNTISYNFEVAVDAIILEEQEVEIAEDLFMLTNEVNVKYDCIENKNYGELVEQSESIMSQTDITLIEDFDDLVGVYQPKIELFKIEHFDEKDEILAKISALALYKTSDGIEKLDIFSDVKFEILKQGNNFVDEVSLEVQMVSAKVKAGKEIELVLKANCHAQLCSTFASMFVKSYELADEKQADEAGIKVYIARENQTIFDVSKALNVKPELIASQNEVEDTFEAGQKVYVYSPINLL